MPGPRIHMQADDLREWLLVWAFRAIKAVFKGMYRHPFITIPTLLVSAFLTAIGKFGATIALILAVLGVIPGIIAWLWPWGMLLALVILLVMIGFDLPGQFKDIVGKRATLFRVKHSWDFPWQKQGSPTMRGYWLRSHWSKACRKSDLIGNREFRMGEPKLLELTAMPAGLQGKVDMSQTGRTAEYFVEHAERLSSSLKRVKVVARQISANIVDCKFYWIDPLAGHVTTMSPMDDETRIPYGISETGEHVSLSPFFSTLIVGMTGSGKSSLVWSALKGLLLNGVPFALTVIDPKSGMEFRSLKDHSSFAYTEVEFTKLLTKTFKSMVARERWLASQGLQKLEEVTLQNPLHILIIDELLEVINKDTEPILRSILTRGRASGFVVMGLSQASVKEVLGQIREYFPQRIALATKTNQTTDAALGPGATSLGALAHKIKIPGEEGIGYEMNDNAALPTRFRALFVDKSEKEEIVIQTATLLDMIRSTWPDVVRTGIVYKYYDANKIYIYIGKTIRGAARFNEHHDTKDWLNEAVGIDLEHFDNECDTLKREAELIYQFKPKYNTQGVKHKMVVEC